MPAIEDMARVAKAINFEVRGKFDVLALARHITELRKRQEKAIAVRQDWEVAVARYAEDQDVSRADLSEAR